MPTFHELQAQRQALQDELDELEEAADSLADKLRGGITIDADELAAHHEQFAWLQRQRAGLLVVLGETERGLLALDADD